MADASGQVTTPCLWFLGLWMRIMAGLRAFALLLSLAGVYAVLAHTVATEGGRFMLNHVLAVLGLSVYGFEIYRTVQRFGVRRRGIVGGIAGAPRMHMLMAVVMTVVFFTLAASLAAVPFWVGPAGAVINAVYLVMAFLYARRRKQ